MFRDDVDRAVLVRVAHHMQVPIKHAAVQPRHECADSQRGGQRPFIEQACFSCLLACKHKQHRAEPRLNAEGEPNHVLGLDAHDK